MNEYDVAVVCGEMFTRSMPHKVETVCTSLTTRILRTSHFMSETDFEIHHQMMPHDSGHRFLSPTDFGKRTDYGDCYKVYQLTPGNKRYQPVAWWQSPDIHGPNKHPNLVPTERLVQQLRESTVKPVPRKHVWGVLEDTNIVELLLLIEVSADTPDDDQVSEFWHMVPKGTQQPKLKNIGFHGQRFDWVDFWQAITSGHLKDFESLMSSATFRWLPSCDALVLNGEVFAEPELWLRRPALAVETI